MHHQVSREYQLELKMLQEAAADNFFGVVELAL